MLLSSFQSLFLPGPAPQVIICESEEVCRMETSEQNGNIAPTQITVDDVDVDFLPLIYDIIRSVERDPHDTSQKTRESQDVSQKVLELHKKFDEARAQIGRLPGVEYSKEEQQQKLETLRKQLQLKKDLLRKYRNMCTFEIPKS